MLEFQSRKVNSSIPPVLHLLGYKTILIKPTKFKVDQPHLRERTIFNKVKEIILDYLETHRDWDHLVTDTRRNDTLVHIRYPNGNEEYRYDSSRDEHIAIMFIGGGLYFAVTK